MQTLKPGIKMANQAIARGGSSTKRLTGNSLYAIHKRFARAAPRLCVQCDRLGLVGYGKELDHIVPLWQGGAESDSNRQWLCEVHHQEKTSAEASQRAEIDGGKGG
jgi:5-methylcytosine-specific restriction enzyme A